MVQAASRNHQADAASILRLGRQPTCSRNPHEAAWGTAPCHQARSPLSASLLHPAGDTGVIAHHHPTPLGACCRGTPVAAVQFPAGLGPTTLLHYYVGWTVATTLLSTAPFPAQLGLTALLDLVCRMNVPGCRMQLVPDAQAEHVPQVRNPADSQPTDLHNVLCSKHATSFLQWNCF